MKLSDSYQVFIKLSKNDFEKLGISTDESYIEWFECTNVTLPTFKYKEETYKYGNNRRTILIPDYESIGNLELTLLENYTDPNMPLLPLGWSLQNFKPEQNNTLCNMQSYIDLFLSKLFDIEHFSYKLHDYIPEIKIIITSNDFTNSVLEYRFTNLKLISYDTYQLDYSSTSPVSWKLSFVFQGYTISIPDDNDTAGLQSITTPDTNNSEIHNSTNFDSRTMSPETSPVAGNIQEITPYVTHDELEPQFTPTNGDSYAANGTLLTTPVYTSPNVETNLNDPMQLDKEIGLNNLKALGMSNDELQKVIESEKSADNITTVATVTATNNKLN